MRAPLRTLLAALILALSAAAPVAAQLPSIAEKTEGLERMDGLLPLYWDAAEGKLWMEIPELGVEMIHYMGFGAGLGSNDLGLDRGALRGSRIVKFERVGRKVLMVQPNYRFRASSDNPDEVRAVRDAFARSVVWSFTAAGETDGRVLVDVTDFLLTDHVGAAAPTWSVRRKSVTSTSTRPSVSPAAVKLHTTERAKASRTARTSSGLSLLARKR